MGRVCVAACNKNAPLTQSFSFGFLTSTKELSSASLSTFFYEKVELIWFSWDRILTPQFEDDFGINPYLNQILILDVSDWLYHVKNGNYKTETKFLGKV